jgi:hypothetical protein
MDLLDALEDEPLELHSGDIGNNGQIVDRAKLGLVVQLVTPPDWLSLLARLL